MQAPVIPGLYSAVVCTVTGIEERDEEVGVSENAFHSFSRFGVP